MLIIIASKGKRKYKPGVKLYQVERLVDKRKWSNKVSHIIMIILQSCKQWTADFMTSVFTCTLQYITFELPTLKCLAKFPKWLPKQRKKSADAASAFCIFLPCCDTSLAKIFEGSLTILKNLYENL